MTGIYMGVGGVARKVQSLYIGGEYEQTPYIVKDGVVQSGYSFTKYVSNYNNSCSGQISYNPLTLKRTGASITAVQISLDLTSVKKIHLTLSNWNSRDTIHTVSHMQVKIYKGDISNESARTELVSVAMPSQKMGAFDLSTVLTADVSSLGGTQTIAFSVNSGNVNSHGDATIKDIWIEK